jgi:hypothetical protein
MAEVAEKPAKSSPVNYGTAQMEVLKAGDYLSYTSYIQVKSIQGMNLEVEDQRGIAFSIKQGGTMQDSLVNQTMHSAHSYSHVEKKTRSELLEIFAQSGDVLYTVEYRKQVDPLKAFDQIKTGNKLKSHEEQKKDLKKALEGEPRTLIGHTISSETGMGRSLVYDLESKGFKQVDHRTIDSLILKGVKYIVK